MKVTLLLTTTLLSLGLASPLANPDPQGNIGVGKCACRPPICPMELIAECKCKNAAAQACYESWIKQGAACPKPEPKPCGPLSAIS